MKTVLKIVPFTLIILWAWKARSQDPGWFSKVTSDVNLAGTETALFTVADINNDDYPDIVTISTPSGFYAERKPVRIYLNIQDPQSTRPQDRKFIDVTAQSQVNIVPPDTGNHANCLTLADFNNDGNLDLVTGNFYYKKEQYTLPNDRCQIYLGDGTGNFTWVAGNGLGSLGLINVRALSALDYDRDGKLDLFIAAWFKDYTNNVWDHGYLMKGNGDGTFTDMTAASGIGSYLEPMYGSAATDFNNDCYPDIFTAPYCRTGGKVFKNDGNGHFSNVSDAVGYNLYRRGNGQQSCTFSVIPEDVNNDGYMDAFLSVVHGGNAAGEFRSTIAINKGPDHGYGFDIDETLLPVAPPASYHRGDYDGAFFDMDNDGLKDLVMTQATYQPATDRTYFWKQQADHSFRDVTGALGLVVAGLKASVGVEAIDYDLDGDDDVAIVGAGAAYFDIWRNNIGSTHNRVSVKLAPHDNSGINRSAIGARIYVYYQGKMQMREIMAGRGQHMGQQPFILNFGLGDADRIDSITVKWPDSHCSRKTVYNPPVNGRVTINSFPAGIGTAERQPELKIFPNPVTRYLVVQQAGLAAKVRHTKIADISGRTWHVPPGASDGDKLIFDLAGLPEGIYLLQLTFRDAPPRVYKVIRGRDDAPF